MAALREALGSVVEDTVGNVEKKQARTYEELQAEQAEADEARPSYVFGHTVLRSCKAEPVADASLAARSHAAARAAGVSSTLIFSVLLHKLGYGCAKGWAQCATFKD